MNMETKYKHNDHYPLPNKVQLLGSPAVVRPLGPVEKLPWTSAPNPDMTYTVCRGNESSQVVAFCLETEQADCSDCSCQTPGVRYRSHHPLRRGRLVGRLSCSIALSPSGQTIEWVVSRRCFFEALITTDTAAAIRTGSSMDPVIMARAVGRSACTRP